MELSLQTAVPFKTLEAATAAIDGLGMDVHKLGTSRIKAVLQTLGNPQDRVPALHVVGTNGKGSVTAYLTAMLQAAGFRCGTFTSPHLVDVRERIQVNGRPIDQSAFIEATNRVFMAMGAVGGQVPDPASALSYFECLNAMAFDEFARLKLDVAVIEAGLGGRLDSTNVMASPLAVVVTPISMDHMARLGPTLTAIAEEKAAVIKPGVPVVSGFQPDEVMAVLRAKAQQAQAPLLIASQPLPVGQLCLDTDDSHRQLGQYASGLLGPYQAQNLALVLKVLEAVDSALPVPEAARCHGIAHARWPGRYQWVAPYRLLLDGSHNEAGLNTLVDAINQDFGHVDLCWVLSLKRNRSLAMLQPLLQCAQTRHVIVLAPPAAEAERFHEPEAMADFVAHHAPEGTVVTIFNDATFLDWLRTQPRQESFEGTLIVAAGSLYTTGRLLKGLALGEEDGSVD